MNHPEPPETALERICEAHYAGGQNRDGVQFSERVMHDVVNYTLQGIIAFEGETYGFLIDDGNWDGTVVRYWGDPEEMPGYVPEQPEPLTFLPRCQDANAVASIDLYIRARDSMGFQAKERALNYDRVFGPGTMPHYRAWAEQCGYVIGHLSDLNRDYQDAYLRRRLHWSPL